LKNLYSPIKGMISLSLSESILYDKLLRNKKTFNIIGVLKLLFLDVILLPWRKNSNYSIKYLKKKPTNIGFWIHMTNSCNLACKYCYINKTSGNISEDVMTRLPELIKDLSKDGFKSIKFKFAGGEPLLNFPQIVKLYRSLEIEAKKYNIETKYTIISNGTVITSNILRFLKRNRKIKLAISLDGIGKVNDVNRVFINGNGTFDRINANIKKALSLGVNPFLSVTVTKDSIPYLNELYKYAFDKNIHFSLNIVRESNCAVVENKKSKDLWDKSFIEKYKKAIWEYKDYLQVNVSVLNLFSDRARLNDIHLKACGIEENYIILDHNGNMHKCQMLISKNQSVGTIFDENWLEIGIPKLKTINTDIANNSKCSRCKWRYLCSGGCSLIRQNQKARYSCSPNCNLYKAIFPEIMKLEAYRLDKFKLNNE